MKQKYAFRLAIAFLLFTLVGSPAEFDRQATFFVGRVKYGQNNGDDCSNVAAALSQLLNKATTIPVQQETKLRLTDEKLFDTPFLFMNGHDDFVLSDSELENLRAFFSHGGFMLASGCCNNPGFPIAWRREFSRIFSRLRRPQDSL